MSTLTSSNLTYASPEEMGESFNAFLRSVFVPKQKLMITIQNYADSQIPPLSAVCMEYKLF